MSKKLVYASTAIIPSTQANSVQIMRMCNALCRFGFDVTLLAGVIPKDKNINVFDYYGIENNFSIVRKISGCHRGSTFLLSLRHYLILKRLASSNQDILFYGRDVISLYFVSRAGRNVIYETHDIVRKGPRSWAERKLIESPNLRKIVFISNELKNAYLEKYGSLLADKKMIVAPDAADKHPNFSEKIGLNGKADFNACYIGAFHDGKGVEFVLDIAGQMPDIGFHLFGGNDRQIYKLKQKSPPNAHFYGYITPARTYKARNAADVFLMPCQKEVMAALNASEISRWMSPMKLFEYMSGKKPIISSNHIVLQEVLEHNSNCLLCDSDDVEQWIRAITRVKQDKQLYNNISETAYKDFLNCYTWDKRIERILFED